MRSVRHGDDALPSLPLAGVVENRHGARRLHNLKEEASGTTKIGQAGSHTTLRQAPVLWTIGPIEGPAPGGAGRRIVRRRLRSPRRRRPVLPTRAGGYLVLAGVCGLQEGELIVANCVVHLLRFRREGRDSS